jgi:prevent-host-death family protein
MKVNEVGAYEAKTHLSELLQKVQEGQVFYITKHGKRIAELKPTPSERPKRTFGQFKGQIWMAPDFDAPLEDFKDYM